MCFWFRGKPSFWGLCHLLGQKYSSILPSRKGRMGGRTTCPARLEPVRKINHLRLIGVRHSSQAWIDKADTFKSQVLTWWKQQTWRTHTCIFNIARWIHAIMRGLILVLCILSLVKRSSGGKSVQTLCHFHGQLSETWLNCSGLDLPAFCSWYWYLITLWRLFFLCVCLQFLCVVE